MNTARQGNLSDILEDIWQDPQDRVRHMLVLTYKFDARQLLNLVCATPLEDDFQPRHNHLREVALLRPLGKH